MDLGESFVTIIVIVLAAGLMFIFPLSEIAQMNDEEALAMVQSFTTEFANNIMTTGELTESSYNDFISKLNATGNSYEVEIELHIMDENPGKKTENKQTVDATSYYTFYTPQITEHFEKYGTIFLKEGDYIVVKVRNTNTTVSQMFKIMLYGSSDLSSIYAQASGLVLRTAQP